MNLNKKNLFIATSAFLVVLFAVATWVYNDAKREALNFLAKENKELFMRDYSPRFGNPEAKVYLTEFLDPECESCRRFYPEVKSILKEFDGKVQLVVRYAPFHHNSKHAIAVLEATKEQDKYWESLEMLFHYQPYWADHHNPKPELVFDYLIQIGLDIDKLKKDMQAPKIQKIIEQDLSDLRTLNVRGTPTFFINGRALENFSVMSLREMIASEVKRVYQE